jgi:uncharacterized phosphosugar-binding protein
MLEQKEYLAALRAAVKRNTGSQRAAIGQAAEMIGETMTNNGLMQLVGVGGGVALVMELGFRAGGLIGYHGFGNSDLALRGDITKEENDPAVFNENEARAHQVWDLYQIDPRDNFILSSYTGCEPYLVEIGTMAKQQGHKIIAVVCRKACDATPARHSSGKKITDLADLVLDTGAEYPDLVVDVDGTHKMAQMNSILSNIMAQELTAQIYRYLVDHGVKPPVVMSANVTGADEHNRKLAEPYGSRWGELGAK